MLKPTTRAEQLRRLNQFYQEQAVSHKPLPLPQVIPYPKHMAPAHEAPIEHVEPAPLPAVEPAVEVAPVAPAPKAEPKAEPKPIAVKQARVGSINPHRIPKTR